MSSFSTRARQLNSHSISPGPVVYWMSRDQRVDDNWALLFAQQIALEQKSPLLVVFCLQPNFLEASWRQYHFMLQGLSELVPELSRKNISFSMKYGAPEEVLPQFLKEMPAAGLVTDFSPLRINRQWKQALVKKISIPLWEVDTHNIVPAWIASDKQEYAARTFRPKIHRQLDEYLTEIPSLKKHPYGKAVQEKVELDVIKKHLKIDFSVEPVEWLKPGSAAANTVLSRFVDSKLSGYQLLRNDPTQESLSNLSPYLHFGQISPQRVALVVKSTQAKNEAKQVFLEELVVRRELADNFCFYNDKYDSFEGFPNWAQQTLRKHERDPREVTYSRDQLELGKTHDQAWNACQLEMVTTGKMHGYMRMYWAKKILEWSEDPETALKTAIYLNDRYELDGRDPNGYVGVAWAIGGVHDRPWAERPIFGTVRYMNEAGLRRKFKLAHYVDQFVSPQ